MMDFIVVVSVIGVGVSIMGVILGSIVFILQRLYAMGYRLLASLVSLVLIAMVVGGGVAFIGHLLGFAL